MTLPPLSEGLDPPLSLTLFLTGEGKELTRSFALGLFQLITLGGSGSRGVSTPLNTPIRS